MVHTNHTEISGEKKMNAGMFLYIYQTDGRAIRLINNQTDMRIIERENQTDMIKEPR